jgi:Glycosyltransferase family 92
MTVNTTQHTTNNNNNIAVRSLHFQQPGQSLSLSLSYSASASASASASSSWVDTQRRFFTMMPGIVVNGGAASTCISAANNGGGGANHRRKGVVAAVAAVTVTVASSSSASASASATSSSKTSSNRAPGGASRKVQTTSSTSTSSTAATSVVIQILILLCILYVCISAYAFYGFHHHHHHHHHKQQQLHHHSIIDESSSSSSSSVLSTTELSLKKSSTTATTKKAKEKDHHPPSTVLIKDAADAASAASAGGSSFLASSSVSSTFFSLQANRQAAERLLQLEAQYASRDSADAARHLLRNSNILTAYIEGPLHDTIPGTGNRGDVVNANKHGSNEGTPPDLVIPLPLRTQSPSDLQVQQYPGRLQTCRDLPSKFPVDRGLELVAVTVTDEATTTNQSSTSTTTVLQPVVWNVGDEPVAPTFVQDELPFCPVESDPFLPWIHDVFPSLDGKHIYFIAQNKRRCRTGVLFDEAVNRLVPQVALMQGISVVRLQNGEHEAKRLAPQLWSPPTTADNTHDDDDDDDDATTATTATTTTTTTPRYRLVPIEEATPDDGQLTRFICRFHTTDYSSSSSSSSSSSAAKTIVLGETLSQYPFNYELAAYRKGRHGLITPRGKDGKFFWASNLQFTCPVPALLQATVAQGSSLLSDNATPTLFVDVIPIRTSVRYNNVHMTEGMIGPKHAWRHPAFNATLHWGPAHVLPRVEASGRWENIPICLPPQAPPLDDDDVADADDKDADTTPAQRDLADVDIMTKEEDEKKNDKKSENKPPANNHQKQHYLSACLWASAEFKTRGIAKHGGATTDTMDRLQEWLEFHFLVGFDHVYVYDNSGAHTNTTNLQPVLSQYPASKVTWIDWPSIVCNNNIPAHDSTGERSSQYAAENSCRTRYAPYTTWIAAFDTDEYFVPMGNYSSLRQVLRKAQDGGTNILSFRSSRGRLRMDKTYRVNDGDKSTGDKRAQLPNATYLEAYNCDSAGSPKPMWADRARKQIYQTDYVLYHYVHYSTVTKGYMETYQDHVNAGHSPESWSVNFAEKYPSERTVDEMNEAVLVHTKTIKPDQTGGWTQRCQYDYKQKWKGCWVAFPWPGNGTIPEKKQPTNHDEHGFEYNCYINDKVDQFWVPRLRAALEKRRKKSGIVSTTTGDSVTARLR